MEGLWIKAMDCRKWIYLTGSGLLFFPPIRPLDFLPCVLREIQGSTEAVDTKTTDSQHTMTLGSDPHQALDLFQGRTRSLNQVLALEIEAIPYT